MRSKLMAAALALLAFSSTGCGLKMTRASFIDPIWGSHQQLEQAKAHRAELAATYQAVSTQSTTPKAVPYPEMATLLPKMDAALAAWGASQKRMDELKAGFERLAGDRPDLSSDRPKEWAEFQPMYEEEKVLIPKVNEQMQAYATPAQRFVSLANDNGIRHLKVDEVKGQLAGNLNNLDKAVTDLRGQMSTMRAKLQERTAMTLGLDQEKKRHTIIDQMQALTDQVETAGKALKGKVSAFEATLAGKKEIYQGPGLPKLAIIEEVSQGLDKIKGLVGQMNGLADQWNAMNK
jgi:hypothetical protein